MLTKVILGRHILATYWPWRERSEQKDLDIQGRWNCLLGLKERRQKVAMGFSEHSDELQEIRFVLARLEQPPESKKKRLGF